MTTDKSLREEIPEKWKKFYEGFEKDLRENWINKKELEKRIDRYLELAESPSEINAYNNIKEMLK